MAARLSKKFDKACGKQDTFTMGCFKKGKVAKKDEFPVHLVASKASLWSIDFRTWLTGGGGKKLPMLLSLDLGHNIYILGFMDGKVLRMYKIRIAGPSKWVWKATRFDDEYGKRCAKKETFVKACFKGKDPGKGKISLNLKAHEVSVLSISFQTSFLIKGGKRYRIKYAFDLGNNFWIIGFFHGDLKMIKLQILGPKKVRYLGIYFNKKAEKSCLKQDTFGESCYKGEKQKLDMLNPNVKISQASLWSINWRSVMIGNDDKQLKIQYTYDLGSSIWIVGAMDKDVLKMVKFQITGSKSFKWLGARFFKKYKKACTKRKTFAPSCFKGDKQKKAAFSVRLRAKQESSWRFISGTMIDSSITLNFDMGNNVWFLGFVDDGMLKMVKIRITHHSKSVWLGTRYDRAFGKQCSAPTTFTDACFKGNDPNKNMFPVKIKALEVFRKVSKKGKKGGKDEDDKDEEDKEEEKEVDKIAEEVKEEEEDIEEEVKVRKRR